MESTGIRAIVVLCSIAVGLSAATPVLGVQEEETATASPAPPPAKVSRLQGTAYLDRNEDVVGAAVIVHEMEDLSEVYMTSTDGHGRFKLEGLPDGDYRVRVERHGVAPVIKDNVSVKFPFRAVVELDMEEVERGPILPSPTGYVPQSSGTVRITGQILGAGGLPMGEAHARIVRTDALHDPQTVTTDEDGRFELPEVPVGEWMVTIYGVGHLPIRTTVPIDHDANVRVSLVLQPASYEPSPLELMPIEEPIRPPGLEQAKSKI